MSVPIKATYGYADKRHREEVDVMNTIIQMLESYDIETVDRILTWVQMRIEHDWDE